jgi:hypothetical protein
LIDALITLSAFVLDIYQGFHANGFPLSTRHKARSIFVNILCKQTIVQAFMQSFAQFSDSDGKQIIISVSAFVVNNFVLRQNNLLLLIGDYQLIIISECLLMLEGY